jgi:hypothetical protein
VQESLAVYGLVCHFPHGYATMHVGPMQCYQTASVPCSRTQSCQNVPDPGLRSEFLFIRVASLCFSFLIASCATLSESMVIEARHSRHVFTTVFVGPPLHRNNLGSRRRRFLRLVRLGRELVQQPLAAEHLSHRVQRPLLDPSLFWSGLSFRCLCNPGHIR